MFLGLPQLETDESEPKRGESVSGLGVLGALDTWDASGAAKQCEFILDQFLTAEGEPHTIEKLKSILRQL
jgi:hypothetical protein